MKTYTTCFSFLIFLIAVATVSPAKAEPLPGEIKSEKDTAVMVLIPAGNFIYGMDNPELTMLLEKLGTPKLDLFQKTFKKESKYLPDYYIDKYEVTNEQYMIFVQETGHRKPQFWENKQLNHPRQPITGVGWEDAAAYAKWAGKRLPTEEEWEKAARGVDGRYWPWGNDPSSKKYNGKGEAKWGPAIVGSYPDGNSPYSLCDMSGNLWEMTTGIFEVGYYAMRGGCFLNAGAYTLTTTRWVGDRSAQENGATWLGFRCVMDVKR